jgi:rod shape-determining protein MreD
MTRARIVAASTAILTALLLQATVVAPVLAPFPVSLPAVLVAGVALVDGPATGMSFGFAAGLLADLGSQHPAGLLALCWLGVGIVCGRIAQRPSLRRDAITAGVVCGAASSITTVALIVVHGAGRVTDAVTQFVPTVTGDALLAVAVVALLRRMLRTESLRALHPVYTELVLGPARRD